MTNATEERLLALLADVAENSSTPAGGWGLVPADLLAEIRHTVDRAATRCPDCGAPMYAGTGCGLCAWDGLPEGPAL